MIALFFSETPYSDLFLNLQGLFLILSIKKYIIDIQNIS